MEADIDYMRQAIALAGRAAQAGEVPVGAVLVYQGRVVGEGWNQPMSSCDPCAHAEVLALRAGGTELRNYRLGGTTLYVTLEPCTMCVGAILHARVERLVYAAPDPKTGAVGSVFELLQDTRHNHRVRVHSGVLAGEASALLSNFFLARRNHAKQGLAGR